MIRLASQRSGDIEIVAESGAGTLQQRRDRSTILRVLPLISDKEADGHLKRHRYPPMSKSTLWTPLYHFPACAPPSTWSTSPVMNSERTRNSAASTISSTEPSRAIGCS